jgi:hypothetical protein
MKYVKDQDGNIFKASIVSSLPEGFEDIDSGLQFESNTEGIELSHLEAEYIEEVPAIEAQAEYWTDGTNTVYDPNDIPTLVDGDGNPYLDPAYTHVAAVEAADAIPAYYKLRRKTGADQEIREAIIEQIRVLRAPLLSEADITINILEDAGQDVSAWRAYRTQLRDITEQYKKVDGDWKVAVESIDVENYEFPAKP